MQMCVVLTRAYFVILTWGNDPYKVLIPYKVLTPYKVLIPYKVLTCAHNVYFRVYCPVASHDIVL